jgi:hypothetical protein
MSTVITLKVKDEQGNVTKRQHEIEDINLLQFEKMMEAIKEIIHELRSDGSLTDLVSQTFEGEVKPDEAEEDELAKDADFIMKIVNSFETLAIRMPKQAFKLLSVLSGVELSLLLQQKFIDVLDIYDAVVEENDIERLVNRVKKSLSVTMAKTKFLNLTRKATAPMAKLIQK